MQRKRCGGGAFITGEGGPNFPDTTANPFSSTGGDMNAENTPPEARPLHGFGRQNDQLQWRFKRI